jgi:tetratricopeptide (TPR) repeat protein
MVDDLSDKLRTNLRGDLEKSTDPQLALTDMTQSVEAFRCYSKALDNIDKFYFTDAYECLQKAIGHDSAFAKAYLLLSKMKWHMGEKKAAVAAITKAKIHESRLSASDHAWMRLVEAELDGDTPKILTALNHFLRMEPADTESRLRFGEMCFNLKQYDRAIQEYERIIELNPRQKLAYNQLAYLYAFRGDYNTALEYIDTYTRLAPDEPNPYDSRGEILMMAGRLEEAVDQFKIALAKKADYFASAQHLSEIYAELDNMAQALYYADYLLDIAENDYFGAVAHIRKAELLWRDGKIVEAGAQLHNAAQKAPSSVTQVLLAGEMYRSTGDSSMATQLYSKFLERYANTEIEDIQIHDLARALRFFMEADLPPAKLIPVLTDWVESEKRPLHRQLSQMNLALLHLRNDDHEKSKECMQKLPKELLELLTQFPNAGWSSSWKYQVEAIQRQPDLSPGQFEFADDLLQAAARAGRKDLQVIARFLQAQLNSREKNHHKVVDIYSEQGTPLEEQWRLIGPFENRSGFLRSFPPEQGIDIDGKYKSRGQVLTWQQPADDINDGYLDLRKGMPLSSWSVAYAALSINSPDKRRVQLRLGSDEACKLWLNDKLVWQAYRSKEVPIDYDIVSVVLHPGDNNILMKVTNSIRDWGFYFRVTDKNGDGIPAITFKAVDKSQGLAGL